MMMIGRGVRPNFMVSGFNEKVIFSPDVELKPISLAVGV